MKAFISAGGKGTRLVSVTNDEIPKPMALLNGKPILLHAVESLKKHGVTELYISVGHLREKITGFFGDGGKFGVKINYIIEDAPLGSCGALYYVKDKIKEDFIVCSGDALFDVDLKSMLAYHKSRKSDLTLICRPNNHPFDSDLVLQDKSGRVSGFLLKNQPRGIYKNVANAGFFAVSPNALSFFKEPSKASMEHDFICGLIRGGKRVFGYPSTEYIKDMGTPERLAEGEADLANNIPCLKSKLRKQKAIFLDRDGVLNRYKGFINDPGQIELYGDTAEAVKKINNSGYLSIIVSNQPVVARGECSEEALGQIFNALETLLGNGGAYVNGAYYCPHHPDGGFAGEVPGLKIKCKCRKPETGMIDQAVKDFNLDLSQCIMIGDDNRDLELAKNAGIPAVLIQSELKTVPKFPAEFIAKNLA